METVLWAYDSPLSKTLIRFHPNENRKYKNLKMRIEFEERKCKRTV
jgi:hypothetical protein